MEKINNLLNQIAIINKKNAEILEATDGRFNIFRICGINHYENTHSAILAEFLNSKGTHGLKSKLLECFIDTLGDCFTIEKFNHNKSRVYTEYLTKEGRIDILIEDNQKKAIIIENKIYAKDEKEQLKRYNRYAQKYKNGYQILYLTLLGDNASEQSGSGVSYLPISYKENIINWLEKCVAIASRLPIVRETIIQYINHLKYLTNQDMYIKNKEEIIEVLSKNENLRVAKVIYQNYSETFDYLIEKHFNPKMEDFAKQKGLEYHYERSEEHYVGFRLTNSNWQEKYWIHFRFVDNHYHYGLCNNPDVYRISDENRKTLHDNLKKLNIPSPKDSNWWPFYDYKTNLSLEAWEDDIIKSDNFLDDCKDKIKKIILAMEGINF
ncbi:MAG: PD-(D/E)XK nuclease family protein [Bacteroidales bacterium]